MADAPEIKVKLTAEDTGVASAIKELTSQLKNLKKQQDETAESAFTLKSAFEGLVVVGGLLKLEQVGKEAFNSAVNIGKMADKTGLSTQTLSVFHKVADDMSVSVETVDKGLQKAASTITQFEQGVGKSAKGFQLLNLTQKDFAGLKPDEKIALVTDRLGKMEKSFAKAEAQRQIFGKGAGDLTLVLNSLAAQGFEKATEETSKLGLLLDQDSADSFRAAKASVQELSDVFQGMATQLEAGLLPAVSDIGEALADSLTQGGVSFKTLGQYAGDVVRGIALVFLGLGQTIGSVFESEYEVAHKFWELLIGDAKNFGTVASLVLKGQFSQASNQLLKHGRENIAALGDEVQRQKAIFAALGDSFKQDVANLFPSAEEEERRRKARISKLRPDKERPAPEITAEGPSDAAGKAALAFLLKQLEDELAIKRAYAKQSEQIDQELFEKGEISIADYYDLRRSLSQQEAEAEIAILRKGLADAQAEEQKFALAKAKAGTPKEADRQEANRLQALAKIDELQTKIRTTEITAQTNKKALDAAEFKATEENKTKLLEYEKQLASTQADARAQAEAEIAIEEQKLRVILAQKGVSQEQIDAEAAHFREAKTAQVNFTETQKDGAATIKSIEDQKALIQDKVANGQLFQIQADQQIRDLEQSRLPQLQQIAAQLVEQAKLTGDIQKIQAAEDFQKQVAQMGTASNQVGQQVAALKANVQTSLTGGFANLFTSLISGTRSVGDAFRNLAGSVLNSLSQIAAQMLAQLILTKLLKSALGGFAGGGAVPSVGSGFAEGGLIRGPGGPTSDSIPARVSPGEFIVKASSVKDFGVQNLEAINRGLKVPSLERLSLPKFAEGGLVGNVGGGGGDSQIHLGIGLDEGLILKHLSSKAAGNIILQHLSNNPKAAQHALSRSD
jgi:hypothetical protein